MPFARSSDLVAYLKAFETTIRKELAATEPNLAVTATPATAPSQVMTPGSQKLVLDVLYANPQGVLRMSRAVPGLVETSNNLGIVAAQNGVLQVTNFARSSVDSELDDAAAMIGSVWDLAGAQHQVQDRFPGWDPNPSSPLLALFKDTYKGAYGRDAGVVAIHAGLETGVVASKYPQMDIISIGPTLLDVHSPTERVQVSSMSRVVDLLISVLGRMPTK